MLKIGFPALAVVSMMVACSPTMEADALGAPGDASMSATRDDATTHDAGSESSTLDGQAGEPDAALSDDDAATRDEADAGESASPNSADWFVGEWLRPEERPILTTGNNDVLTANIAADGTRTFRFLPYNSRSSTVGTWRALSGGSVELRASNGTTTVLDRSKVLANCELVEFDGIVLRRASDSTSSCPFARPITDRECSLEGRSFSWLRPGTGDGERFYVMLLSNRVGMYISTFQRLVDCIGECTYSTLERPIQFFEWSIESDQLRTGGISIPTDALASRSGIPECRRSTFYTAPTNLNDERCGDGLCRALETSVDCPTDCGYAPDQRCPVGGRCSSESGARTCASNSNGSTEGTCRPTCRLGDSACASACCGSTTAGEAYACFPASACNDVAPRCREMDQPCEDNWDCCSVANRSSLCVLGLDSAHPDAGACRPSCFVDSDCGRDAFCSCRLTDGRRVCSRVRNGC